MHHPSPAEKKKFLVLLAYERNSKQIAQELFISPQTVISHRKNLMDKLGVKNVAGLIRKGFQLKILFSLSLLLLSLSSYGQTEMEFRTDGIVLPRVDSNTVSSPVMGQLIYDITSDQMVYYNGNTWTPFGLWSRDGSDVYYHDGNVSLGAPSTSTGAIMSDHDLFIHRFGSNNMFAGRSAGNLTISGSDNTGIGEASLTNNTTGSKNTAVGGFSLATNNQGSSNTAIGRSALLSNSTGHNNTALGSEALLSLSQGNDNTAIGRQALLNNVSGSSNTAIGANADVLLDNLVNATAIGANAVVGANNTIVLGSTGLNRVHVGIGDITPDGLLEIDAGGILSDYLVISSDNTENGDVFLVQDNGNVSIGSSTPGTDRLELEGPTEVTSSISMNNTGTPFNGSHIAFKSEGIPYAEMRAQTPDGTNSSLRFKTSKGGTLDAKMVLDENGYLGLGTTTPGSELEIQADDSDGPTIILDHSGNGFLHPSALEYRSQGARTARIKSISTNNSDGALIFETAEGGTLSQQMTLTQEGWLGLGTSLPTKKIEIAGDTEDKSSIILNNIGSPDNASHLEFQSEGDEIAQIRGYHESSGDNSLQFRMKGTSSYETSMLINEDGDIGMGTTNPLHNLHLIGTNGACNIWDAPNVRFESECSDDHSTTILELKFPQTDEYLDNDYYIGFLDNNDAYVGAIVANWNGTNSTNGVKYKSLGADFAESLERSNHQEVIDEGDIVGVVNGKISKNL